METFELAAEGLNYPEEIRIGALLALDGLIRSAERRNGPFMTIPLALPRVDLETLSTDEVHAILDDFDEAIVRPHP